MSGAHIGIFLIISAVVTCYYCNNYVSTIVIGPLSRALSRLLYCMRPPVSRAPYSHACDGRIPRYKRPRSVPGHPVAKAFPALSTSSVIDERRRLAAPADVRSDRTRAIDWPAGAEPGFEGSRPGIASNEGYEG